MCTHIYKYILTQSFWTGTKVIRRKHIIQPTGFGACSSTCCQWDGEDVPAPWEWSNSHPPVRWWYWLVCTLHYLIVIIMQTYLNVLNFWNTCQVHSVECVSRIDSSPPSAAYMRHWTGSSSAPSHYLNQYWDNVNLIPMNKSHWNINQNTKLSIHENAFQNVACEMAAILFGERWVKSIPSVISLMMIVRIGVLYYYDHMDV